MRIIISIKKSYAFKNICIFYKQIISNDIYLKEKKSGKNSVKKIHKHLKMGK